MIGENKNSWLSSLVRLPFIILALSMIVPYYLMTIGAFKPVPELIQNPPTFTVETPLAQQFL